MSGAVATQCESANVRMHDRNELAFAPPMDAGSRGGGVGRNTKQRITRACDLCNQLRVKCDGMSRCKHCLENGYQCSYTRAVKKRGRAPGKEFRQDHSLSQSPEDVPSNVSRSQAQHSFTSNMMRLPPPIPFTTHINSQAHIPFDHISPLSSIPHNSNPALSSSGSLSRGAPLFGRQSSSVSKSPPSANGEWPEWLAMLTPTANIRYPILHSVMTALPFLTPSLACDMLDSYFAHSPWVKAYTVRRCSILSTDPSQVRSTKPALIYAMLCVAAHSHDDPILSSTPVSRPRILQRLFELTVSALRPLQHEETEASLDDVMTYIQIGTILAGSEFKAMAIRWWTAAYTLAREMNLNREVDGDILEEAREERRRTWWLLYCVDRHHGLCFHKPLALTDGECGDLLHPCDERLWRSNSPLDANTVRPRGVIYQVSDPGLFGFFLPLMSILGEIIELYYLSQHSYPVDMMPLKQSISQHLNMYETNLESYHVGIGMPSPFKFYASQIMHTLYILLAGKWDPISMLNDDDGWILSPEFIECTAHAVEAANAVRGMLSVDPDLMFMPMFFGMYLLQGSFLLLLIIDKLGSQSDPSVLEACEIIVRAHEVCVVTLSTEYQRKFRKVMRAMISGISSSGNPYATEEENLRMIEDTKVKSREIMGLYRWNITGRGLITL